MKNRHLFEHTSESFPSGQPSIDNSAHDTETLQLITQVNEDFAYFSRFTNIPYKVWGLTHDNYFIFLARLIDHEEIWKYTNGSGWC